MSSVRIRCVDIAKYLGWQYCIDIKSANDIPRHYKLFILVKPNLEAAEIERLGRRGILAWDIIDRPPPDGIRFDLHFASSQFVANMFKERGRIEVLPHYHCNFDPPVPTPSLVRRPVWIGQYTWYPLLDFDHDAYDTRGLSRHEVCNIHQHMGIGLNLRAIRPETYWHVLYNSGIKLLNCLGFGIPSVSLREPAYEEWGLGCTLFVSSNCCGAEVTRLQSDRQLYDEMRTRCLERGSAFHISAIAKRYAAIVDSL